jgi:hypothetical protein
MGFRRSFRLGCLAVFCLSGLALAQTTASETPSAAETTRIAQQFTSEKLGIWQQRLRLEDWHIAVTLVRRESLPPETLGGIHWDKGKKTAEVWVLDPADYRLPLQAMLDDMELTIVHELVHLDLASLPKGQASRSSEEQAVNGIAQAMLALDRAKPPTVK